VDVHQEFLPALAFRRFFFRRHNFRASEDGALSILEKLKFQKN